MSIDNTDKFPYPFKHFCVIIEHKASPSNLWLCKPGEIIRFENATPLNCNQSAKDILKLTTNHCH